MNKHILTLIEHQLNPGKYTQEQLEENAVDALAITTATGAYAYAAAAYYADDPHAAYSAASSLWLKRYFELTGENKQDYIDAINKDNKQ